MINHQEELLLAKIAELEKLQLTQSQELAIEAALDEIRTRSMSMNKSEELWDVVAIVFKKFQEMNFSIDGAAIIITKIEGSRDVNAWLGDAHGQPYPNSIRLPYYDSPSITDIMFAIESGMDYYSKTYGFDEKNHWFKYAFENTDLNILTDDLKNWIIEQPYLTQAYAIGKYSSIGLHFHHQRILNDTEVKILKRFSKVFNQAYIRFLDLKKAEAQAKEAQIETALEKVRSRTMGMQKSDELKEVIQVVYDQLVHLNINTEHTGFVLDYKATDDRNIWVADKHGVNSQISIPYFDSIYYNQFNEAKRSGLDFFATNLSFEEKNDFYQKLFVRIPSLSEQAREFYFGCPGLAISTVLLENVGLYMENFMGIPFTTEENATLMRFGKVFQQTYTRFLDLQKAEAQARESKIQLALERVRARTMAMQQSSELAETALQLFQQLQDLGFSFWRTGFYIWKREEGLVQAWTSNGEMTGILQPILFPWKEDEGHNAIYESSLNGESVWEQYLNGEPLKKHYEWMLSSSTNATSFSQLKDAGVSLPEKQYKYASIFKQGYLMVIATEPQPQMNDLLTRFARVFEQCYTRFIDLQKAEEQAKEAMIEAALERVRSKTMAMHNSQDVGETVALMFEELVKLEVKTNRCGILIFSNSMIAEVWTAKSNPNGKASLIIGKLDLTMHPLLQGFYHAWENKESVFTYPMIGDDLISYYQAINNTKLYPTLFDLNALPSKEFHTDFYFADGSIFSFTDEILTEEAIIIFKRFAGVFGQTYRRYLDLQKAEAQVREAQIETALEKVRSRSMGMQKSKELQDVIQVIFQQFQQLNFKIDAASFNLLYSESDDLSAWIASSFQTYPTLIHIPYSDNEVQKSLKEAREKALDSYTRNMSYDEKNKFWEHFFKYVSIPTERQKYLLSCPGYAGTIVLMSHFALNIVNYEGIPYSEEENAIIKRFAKVFEQSYIRFLDLQKAEEQARDAQIETALEKVRSRSLAMQKGNEIVEVLVTIQEKLVELNVNFDSVNILIFSKLTKDVKYWTVISKELKYIDFNFPYVDYSVPKDFSIARANHLNIFSKCYSGAEKDELLYYMFEQTDFRNLPNERKEYLKVSEYFTITIGIGDRIGIQLNSYTRNVFTDEENAILKRFTKVFEQAYIRFLDIQNAEIQALEALKRASVDRVRAEIASMRTSNDLERITPIIWNELTTLGVPFIRCGVFIMDEENQQIQTMLSTAEGKAIASFHLPYENSEPLTELLPHWRKMEIYQENWDEKTFVESTKILLQRGAISSPETYATEHPPTNLHLHFLPFLQGMLYVGNESALNKDELQLVQNLADAFSIAYARYEDFNKLESAKEQIEKTLKDLKATQSLLIQSEKMASLGELTAGIAHEIQNPLNFVNNFSEVSTELVDEMNEEILKGNLKDAKQIAQDLKDNLEKINHHGKRAGDIVRGMLQHSRSSSGQKEPTDINALADEYLRLAYHGLRAKDKTFNATIHTDFDESIGKIPIIPQDIGRVILNLITNAFYVVDEKKKSGIEHYEPTVSVSTKKINDKILISVKDNGNGIPSTVLDKIFQPFFTTKPTGQGTGLGLSLSYDIVKAHGGDIKVNTKVNEGRSNEASGTEFTIQLPI